MLQEIIFITFNFCIMYNDRDISMKNEENEKVKLNEKIKCWLGVVL